MSASWAHSPYLSLTRREKEKDETSGMHTRKYLVSIQRKQPPHLYGLEQARILRLEEEPGAEVIPNDMYTT